MATGLCGTCGGTTPVCACYVTAVADGGLYVSGDGSSGSPFALGAKNRLALPNPVRNPSGLIAQRGTSVSIAGAAQGTLDGWIGYRGGSVAGMTVSRAAVVDTQGAAHAIHVQRDSGNSGVQVLNLAQALTTLNSLKYAGKQITFSFRAAKGADFSAAASTLPVYLLYGTGTDQSYSNGITGQATLATVNAVLSTSLATYSATVNVPSNATQLHIVPIYTPVGTAGAADYYRIKDVRIDEGAYALPHSEPDDDAQLHRAQFFFHRVGGTNLDHIGIGLASLTTKGEVHIPFPRTMRAIPTLTVGNVAHFTVYDAAVSNVSSAVAFLAGPNQTKYHAIVAFTTTGLTVGRAIRVYASGASGYLDFSAEI